MNIDVLCRDGSPLGVTLKSLYGDAFRVGIGGSEYALLTMCEEWTKKGHRVRLYNDPFEQGASPFEQLPISAFNPTDDKDVVITFRSPNAKINACRCLRVFWSCDQQTVGDFGQFAKTQDKIVVISPFHQQYFTDVYKITNSIVIDLPIRLGDYKAQVEKVENRCIFTSVPGRGLSVLNRVWPGIVRDVPDASLVITSDYRLWGCSGDSEPYRLKWMDKKNVTYLAAVPRSRLITEQMQADFHLYTCLYDELFCIAVAESEVAGAIPITTTTGALGTTNMGIALNLDMQYPHGDRTFIETVVKLMRNKELKEQLRTSVQAKAIVRFAPENILQQWDEKVFK